ncbi:MAG: transglutaminase family protein [Rhodoferax sp.]|uniref:transglutaminase family protein n=1 Tax=Rhodoferax sp. TaxID=50421 RepID=UPI001805698F|nr:transglutaminase family protein [Rhodoferax sp.]NMM12800.1 transglutaminase family protein [Rhodoferax sp.]NMM19855.1 transglutaminase family protein [Rhodoferax sp.]
MRLQITHETRYDYLPAVETAQHMAYLQPVNTRHQQLLSHSLQISPTPAQIRQTQDVFGNTRCFFSLQSPHTVLKVVAHSVVETRTRPVPLSRISWEQTRELFRYQSGGQFDAATEFVFASPFVPKQAEFAAYARPSFTPGISVLAAAQDLMRRIHTDFIYESQSTQVNTPALQALAQRKGVCQDFAHIMIACLRVMGIPARYVSGYLLTQPAPGTVKLTGSDASHAWGAVYVPDLPPGERWCDLDPTNNRAGWHSPGEDYVTLATGRDFADVSPIRGVIHGGASHTLSVGVTVEPVANYMQASGRPKIQEQTQSPSQRQSQS